MEEKMDITGLLGERGQTMTAKQVRIVEAAVALFSEKGYVATSTREIAARAQVAEGTIFKQYPTKEALLNAVLQMIIENILFPFFSTGIDELLTRPYASLEEAIKYLLANRLALLQSQQMPRAAFKLVLQEMPFRPEIGQTARGLMENLLWDTFLDNLRAQHLIVDWPKNVVMDIFVTMSTGLVLGTFLTGASAIDSTDEEIVAYWTRFVAKGLAPEGGEAL